MDEEKEIKKKKRRIPFAFLRAGASFTPSPVMPTKSPRFCNSSTTLNLSSGTTWANPSAFTHLNIDEKKRRNGSGRERGIR